MRRTKIICTVGPASRSPAIIRQLMQHVDVFRINFSHGDRQSHLEEIATIRAQARRASKMVAILQDLPGPKIRVGKIAGNAVDLPRGGSLLLTSQAAEGTSGRIPINNPDLLSSVSPGDMLHLADGVIRLRVEDRQGGTSAARSWPGGR